MNRIGLCSRTSESFIFKDDVLGVRLLFGGGGEFCISGLTFEKGDFMSMVYAMSGLILFFGAFVWLGNKCSQYNKKNGTPKKHCH